MRPSLMASTFASAAARPGVSLRLRGYGVAVVAVVVATAARYALTGVLGGSVPYITYYPAVAASALYGGLGPGLLALGSGVVGGATLLVASSSGLTLAGLTSLGVYLLAGSLIVVLADANRRARVRAEAAAREGEQGAEHAAFLAKVSGVLSSLEYETTLASIARLAVPFLADWCSVDVLEPDGSVRRIAITHADPDKADLAQVASTYLPDPERKHPRTSVLRTGRSVLIPVVTDEALASIARDPEHLRTLRAFGYRSVMIVALPARGRTLGAITLVTAESGRQYDAQDLAFAEEIAARAGLALDNAHLYRAAQREIEDRTRAERRLAVQHAATRALAEAPSLAEATPRILEGICGSLGWEWGALWRVDGEGGVLRWVAMWRAPEHARPSFEAASRTRTFRPGEGLPGRVWQRAEAAWIPDVLADDNFPRASAAARDGLRGAFGFPLKAGRSIVGVMEFFSREVREPDEGLREMLATIGSQIGQFIERKQVEDAGRASEERKQAVFEAALDAIITIDATGRITEFNPAAERIFGYARDRVLGREMASLIIPEALREQHRAGLARYLATGRGPLIGRRLELTAIRADGGEFPVELAISRIGSQGPPLFTGFLRDITAAKRAESERTALLARERAARADAEAANRAKDEFLATVSHELRTPLTPILMWTRMLRRGALDAATTTRALETIDHSAKAQVQLIEDLLDVSRIITGKLRLEIRRLDLEPIIEAAIESVRLAAEAKGIALVFEDEADAPSTLGDPARVQQVVWNLLSNAIKFTPAGGTVELRLRQTERDVELSVSDTGKGISPEFLPYVFERFRQADSSTTRAHGGLGLGLAIVRHLVEQHGGSVHVESAGEGQGTRFTVRLPLPPVQAASIERHSHVGRTAAVLASDGAPTQAIAGTRVLAVDDDADTCAALEILLAMHGAEVRTAPSTADALEIVERWRPHVLLSDIAMPGVDGYELIARLRALERGTDTPIRAVALTAYARPQDRAAALAAGFEMHVPKPIEPAVLIAAIVRLMGDPDRTTPSTPVR